MDQLKRVLLVDDSPQDVELTLAAFEEYRLLNEVVVARDGMEALDYLFRRGPYEGMPPPTLAVVMLDLKMPRLGGIEVLQAIREDPSLRQTPVVILTSSREEPDLARCYELGANAYVVKPVEFSDFMEAVRRLGVFWALTNIPPEPAAPPRP